MNSDALRNQARELLINNDWGGYTVPTRSLYPFQWNWDSMFAALGFAVFDRERAWQEIEALFEAQWQDGMVPSIVFHRHDPDYFPGPDVWASGTNPPTSSQSQPPVAATIVQWLVETGGQDDERRAHKLFPKLLASHRWWHSCRDPEETGLVAITHPWESGRDNCPDWDSGMQRVIIADDLGDYHRRDTDIVDPSERPTRQTYDRYLTLVKFGRERNWDHHRVYRESPFLMGDPGVQFILMRADRDLLKLAERFDDLAAVKIVADWLARDVEGADALWSDTVGGFVARELRTGEMSQAISNASMLAFYGGAGSPAQRQELAEQARKILDLCQFGFPSWDPRRPEFEQRRYWRGPVWLVVNWMIATGLQETGENELAQRIWTDTKSLVGKSGFFEYFDPLTGEGLGGDDFTWSAAIYLALDHVQGGLRAA